MMLTREDFYTLLRGEAEDGEWARLRAVHLLREYPYCHVAVLLRGLHLHDQITEGKRKQALGELAVQLPSSMPLCWALARGRVIPEGAFEVEGLRGPALPEGQEVVAPTRGAVGEPLAEPEVLTAEPVMEASSPVVMDTPEMHAPEPEVIREFAPQSPERDEPTAVERELAAVRAERSDRAVLTTEEPRVDAPAVRIESDPDPEPDSDPFAGLSEVLAGLYSGGQLSDEGAVPREQEPPESALEEAHVLDWKTLMGDAAGIVNEYAAPEALQEEEGPNLSGVLASSLQVEVPGMAPSIFPFEGMAGRLNDENLEFVSTVLNPLYEEAVSANGDGQREAIDAYLDNLDALVAKLRTLASDESYSTEGAEDLSAASSRRSTELISERLAQMHVSRGEIDLAVAMYERLSVKNPEKSSYFAGIIAGLREGLGEGTV